jgi:hypothetical protein
MTLGFVSWPKRLDEPGPVILPKFVEKQQYLEALTNVEGKGLDYSAEFRLSEFLNLFDLKKTFVQNLFSQQIIIPVRNERGRGSVRRYNAHNILQILLARSMVGEGLPYERIRYYLGLLQMFIVGDENFIKIVSDVGSAGFIHDRYAVVGVNYFIADKLPTSPKRYEHFLKALEARNFDLGLVGYVHFLNVLNVRRYMELKLSNT